MNRWAVLLLLAAACGDTTNIYNLGPDAGYAPEDDAGLVDSGQNLDAEVTTEPDAEAPAGERYHVLRVASGPACPKLDATGMTWSIVRVPASNFENNVTVTPIEISPAGATYPVLTGTERVQTLDLSLRGAWETGAGIVAGRAVTEGPFMMSETHGGPVHDDCKWRLTVMREVP
ncbi:MAG: hypothetical protein QM778_00705 [Myxococcales bacterium]